ncbi:MAG: glycosyltransferase family 9 protein [Ignavibacteriae bacterium]|nr:glycosyltransferase family 9 protein [Ignavibacteriota bacterium]
MKLYKSDCRHFVGTVPCKPHKQFGKHCYNCDDYTPTDGIILIIKLGAIGDVIRTTPLIHKIKKEYPDKKIWWLTYSPDIVPSVVDSVFSYNAENIEILKSTEFDIAINLDKDLQAGAILKAVTAQTKYGFTIHNGVPAPVNKLADDKFITGLFDDVNQANKLSYLQEIFNICGWQFEGEEYILDCDNSINWEFYNNGKKVVGLNTGCGARWISRLWSDDNWIELIERLQAEGYFPLLLGGSQEDDKNKYFAEKTGASYLGYFSLSVFISLMNKCDAVVSAVTMGMHIAVGLKKPLILMNNIFNPSEFELYGRGEIVQPAVPCKCFFSPKCKNDDYFCMDHLSVDSIFNAVVKSLS